MITRLHHLPESGFGAGLGAGCGFFAGAETPKLSNKKLKPLRSVSNRLMDRFPSPRDYFFFAGIFASGGAGSPRRISTATGGSGLSALPSSRVTCHSSVSVSRSL